MPDAMKVRAIRNFRLRHNLSLQEVADAAGMTKQWISQIEIGDVTATAENKLTMIRAYQAVIHKRRQALDNLEQGFIALFDPLFEEEDEWTES